ncbi:hypothetical protein D3C80_1880150 [compost metagenome]
MPALEDNFAANRRALVLVMKLIRFEVQRGKQRSDIRIMPDQHGNFGGFCLIGHQGVIDVFYQRFSDVTRHLGGGEKRILIAIFQL